MAPQQEDYMIKKFCLALLGILLIPQLSLAAGEASLQLPELTSQYLLFGKTVLGKDLMYGGLGICILGMLFGLFEYIKV